MKHLARAAAASAVLLSAPAARAQALTYTPTTYSAVDAVGLNANRLVVTGVVQGDPSATTKSFPVNYSATYDDAVMQTCVRLATLALLKPGAYLFAVNPTSSGIGYPGCTLTRVTP